MAYGSRSKKSSQPSAGCLVWLLLLCVVLLLFLLNWGKIQDTLKKTRFTEVIKTARDSGSPKEPLSPPAEPAPRIDSGTSTQAPQQGPSAPAAKGSDILVAPVPSSPDTQGSGGSTSPSSTGPGSTSLAPAGTAGTPASPAASAKGADAKAPGAQTTADGNSGKAGSSQPGSGQTGSGQAGKVPASLPARTRSAILYFVRIDDDGSIVRQEVKRQIPGSDSPLTDSLNALLGGPTDEEMRRHLVSLIPSGTKLLSAQVRGGTVYLNFNEAFMYNHYGIEGYAGQLKQVVFTATSFPTVQEVQILIDGERHDYLGGEGVYIGRPLSRESF